MKTLLLLRHAKSSWKDPHLADHERPLNGRGKRDAPRMGRLLLELDLVPEMIVSSTAVRARKTALVVSEAAGYGGPFRWEDAVYHAAADEMVEILRGLPPGCRRAMMVGHNPGCEELLEELTGTSAVMPTAALARIDLDLDDWAEIAGARATLVDVWRPRELE